MASPHNPPIDELAEVTTESTTPTLGRRLTLGRHPALAVQALRTRLDPYPRGAAQRWLLRLLLALPYGVVAILAHGRVDALETPNAELLEHVATIPWDRADIGWVGEVYPPLSTLLVAAIPGGRL